jgi:hypothetical protein
MAMATFCMRPAEGIERPISMSDTLLGRIGFLFARRAFEDLRSQAGPRNYDGGVFLGLNGLVVKSHGGADEVSFAIAIDSPMMPPLQPARQYFGKLWLCGNEDA